MRQKQITVYKFEELSTESKEKVKQQLCSEYAWGGEALQSLREFCQTLGVELRDYCIDYSNSNASYVKISGNPLESGDIKEWPEGYWLDSVLSENYKKTEDIQQSFGAFFAAIEADYLAQFQDEYAKEHCDANEYEFYENGEIA